MEVDPAGLLPLTSGEVEETLGIAMLRHAWIVYFLILLLWGCQPVRGVYHTVKPGQTLYRISKTYGVDEKYIARINGVTDPARLRSGERLFIPGAAQNRSIAGTAQKAPRRPPESTTVSRPSPRESTNTRAPASPAKKIPTMSKTKPGKPPSVQKDFFIWPLRGEILRKFGNKGPGPSKGLEIEAGQGTAVRAAAAGQVIYSDNGIQGYGNLMIIKHQDSFFTVYGYNSRNLIKAGTFVGKGDEIAAVGAPPGGGSPRLYFEVRVGKQAVDPIFYLP